MAGDAGHCGRHLADPALINILRALIRRSDGWLSHIRGVHPFTHNPDRIMRIQAGQVRHDLSLPEYGIRRRAKGLLLHTWNARMPPIPAEGPDLAYGLKLQRLLVTSLHAIAQLILATSSLHDIQAIGGTAHVS